MLDYQSKMMDRDEGEVWGVGILFHIQGDESETTYNLLSWSAVLHDQCKRIPRDELPVIFAITQEGKGTRKYESMR